MEFYSQSASAALTQGEIDWWENPTIDLVPQLKRNKDLTLTVKDRTGEIGCLRIICFRRSSNAAICRVRGGDGSEGDHGGGGRSRPEPRLMLASSFPARRWRVGVEMTRGPKNYDKLKQDLIAAGYKGEKVVILAASTIPTIWAEAQVASDTLKKIGMNTDFQALERGTGGSRGKEPIDKGGWNIFYTVSWRLRNIHRRRRFRSRAVA